MSLFACDICMFSVQPGSVPPQRNSFHPNTTPWLRSVYLYMFSLRYSVPRLGFTLYTYICFFSLVTAYCALDSLCLLVYYVLQRIAP